MNALTEVRSKIYLFGDVVEVADVMEFLHLAAHRLGEARVCVPESTGRDPGNEVEVLLITQFQTGVWVGKGITPPFKCPS